MLKETELAKERQVAGGKNKVPQKSAEPNIPETRDVLAKKAGVSHDTEISVPSLPR